MFNLFEYEAGFNLFKNSSNKGFGVIYFLFVLIVFGVEFMFIFLVYLFPNLIFIFLVFSFTFLYFFVLFFLVNNNV